jgi:two-component system OmpR family response regulator
MQVAQHIAIVDDNRDIRDLVAQYLSQHDYRVTALDGGPALKRLVEKTPPDLIVLDIMMPGEDGLSICRELRKSSAIPVIFLTAMTEDTDRIIGLELGADDYLVKPFNPRELLARIRAVLRRGGFAAVVQSSPALTAKVVRFDQWQLDMGRQELQGPDGVGVPLSTAEFRLLKVLIENPMIVLSREKLLDLTIGRNADPFDRSIDNQVSRLRKKIEPDPKSPSIIKTHWGGGYSLATTVEVVR